MTRPPLEDCEHYNKNLHKCIALKNTYCKFEDSCSFYKPGTDNDNKEKGNEKHTVKRNSKQKHPWWERD
jgi:hypothetical protein